MGQQLARRTSRGSSMTDMHTYSADEHESVDIISRAESLGIPVYENDDPEIVQRLISAHTDGMMTGRGRSRKASKRLPRTGSEKTDGTRSPSVVLRTLRTMPGKMGCDIGGTCAKLVLMMSTEDHEESGDQLPENFGATGKIVSELEERIKLRSGSYVLKFISGETSYLEKLIHNLAERPAFQDLPVREVTVAGGGAHKYAKLFKEALNFEFKKCPEMLSVVEGLRFMLDHRNNFPDAVFQLNDKKEHIPVTVPMTVDRFLMVNMGSGVSVLEVTSESFRRVGGSACGGATFLGLSRLMAGVHTFEEALRMAEQGDGSGLNKLILSMRQGAVKPTRRRHHKGKGKKRSRRRRKLVSDIYGKEGSSALGLSPSLTASNFGKLGGAAMSDWQQPDKTDVCRALLEMVIQSTCVLASAFSSTMGISSVFFTGGFLRDNKIATELLGQSMKNLGAQAYFCKHSDFLGALGSLSTTLGDELWLDDNSSSSNRSIDTYDGNDQFWSNRKKMQGYIIF